MQRTTFSAVAAALVGIGIAGTSVGADADDLPGVDLSTLDSGSRTTFGLGVGALYGGVGLNIGRINGTQLTYGSIGCLSAASSSGSTQTAGDVTTTLDDGRTETNCGIGAGISSTAFLPGERHGLGLNLGLTYDAIDTDEVQWHLRPTCNYFFGGIESSGFNLGFSPVLTFDGDGTDTGLLLNFGYQF